MKERRKKEVGQSPYCNPLLYLVLLGFLHLLLKCFLYPITIGSVAYLIMKTIGTGAREGEVEVGDDETYNVRKGCVFFEIYALYSIR